MSTEDASHKSDHPSEIEMLESEEHSDIEVVSLLRRRILIRTMEPVGTSLSPWRQVIEVYERTTVSELVELGTSWYCKNKEDPFTCLVSPKSGLLANDDNVFDKTTQGEPFDSCRQDWMKDLDKASLYPDIVFCKSFVSFMYITLCIILFVILTVSCKNGVCAKRCHTNMG